MAPFKFGKKKHTDSSATASPPSQKVSNSSQKSSSPQTSSGSNQTFNATSYNTTNSPGQYNTTAPSMNNQQYQQNSAALGYDHNNNIYNPRSPQRAPPTQSPYNQSQYSNYNSPQRQPQFNSPQQYHHQLSKPSTPWARSKLLISPFPRYRHAASTHANEKGEIFVMGGLHNTSVYGDTWIIKQDDQGSFQTFQVDIYENSPAPRVGHASTLCGNAYVIFGGDTVTNDAGEIDNDLYLFNMNSHTWTIPNPVGLKPPGRYGHSIGVIAITNFDSKLYLYGGQLDDTIYNDLMVFNLSSFRRPDVQWELVQTTDSIQPPPLSNHSMDVYDNKLWIFGGSNGIRLSNDLWVFDPLLNKWSKPPTSGISPPPLEEHASVVYKDLLIIHGGKLSSGDPSQCCYFLNLITKTWFKFPNGLNFEPQGKYGHSISILNNDKLLILGGHLPDYANLGDDLEPSIEDNGVGTLLNTLDLSNLAAYLPNLYQYGTPTRMNEKEKFSSYSNNEFPKPIQQNNIFTPPQLNEASPIKSIDNEDIGLNRNVSQSSNLRSTSSNIYPPKGITAEDVFQQKFSNSNSPIEQSSISRTPQKEIELTPTRNQNQINSPYSSPEEELPLEIPPPFENHTKDLSSNDETNDNKVHEGSSYINSNTRVSEFFDSYVNNDSSVNLSDEKFVDASHSLRSTESILKPVEPDSSPADTSNIVPTEISNNSVNNVSKSTETTNGNGNGKAIGLAAAVSVGATAGGVLASAFKSNEKETSLKEIPISISAPIPNTATNKEEPLYSTTTSNEDEREEFKSIIKSLSTELESLKLQTNEQAKIASEKVRQLEIENEELKSKIPVESSKEIQPEETESDIKRNYIKLNTDYQVLNKDNESLRLKINEIEPIFSTNLINLNSLNELIKSQELENSEIKRQLKESESWKFKYDELNLKFEKLQHEHEEIKSKDLDETDEEISEASKLTSALDSFISKYTIRDEESNDIKAKELINNEGNDVTVDLKSQIDELLKENQELESKNQLLIKDQEEELKVLKNRINELSKIEENYKDSLQTVKNTSKALQIAQNETSKQKDIINQLKEENDELKIFNVRKNSRNATPQMNEFKNENQTDNNDDEDNKEDFENEHYNLKIKDLQAELFITKQDNNDLKQEILTLKKKLLTNTV